MKTLANKSPNVVGIPYVRLIVVVRVQPPSTVVVPIHVEDVRVAIQACSAQHAIQNTTR